MRYKADIYALRIGNVIEPHEYGQFKRFAADPPLRKRNAWSYIDARDLGEIVRLCLEKDGLGFQVFNAVNDTITLNMPTREAMARLCPKTPVTRDMGEFEAPLSNRKIARGPGLQAGARLAPVCEQLSDRLAWAACHALPQGSPRPTPENSMGPDALGVTGPCFAARETSGMLQMIS